MAFDPNDSEHLHISFVPKWMWVHPMVLCMTASLALTVDRKNINCQKVKAKSGHYLERMGLFNFLGVKSGMNISEHDPSGRFIPITQIKDSKQLTTFITEMVPMLHLKPGQAEPIRYIVSELVRNVLEHAEAKNGAFLCAQYFKTSNIIRLGIADTGIGIRKSLSQSHTTSDDKEAIKLALMPGVTGTTSREGGTEQNAGAGLFFIKSIAYTSRNFLVMYSGSGMYKLLKKKNSEGLILHANPDIDRHSDRNDLPVWNGTVVGVDISLESTSEFTQLLDLIRTTYSNAVRERRKKRFKEAKFI